MDLVEAQLPTATRHPWELARASFFNRLTLSACPPGRPVQVLDAGCGDAWFSRQLLPFLPAGSEVVGWDTALDDERLAVFSSSLAPSMTLSRDAPAGDFDVILCMDVLEHVADDLAFASDLCGRLKPGGYFVCSVPAWPGLFSRHDLALRHFRRYTPWQARKLLEAGGLTLVRKGGLFHGLAAVRRLQLLAWGRAEPLADPFSYVEPEGQPVGLAAWNASPAVTALVAGALRAEGHLSRVMAAVGLEVPGLSWWALCRKR
jgi:SAM-dependent methyltransferase